MRRAVKTQDDAVIYGETLRDLVVGDPLGGETEADKELRESSAKHAENMLALKEVVTRDWSKMSVPTAGRQKRSVKTGG